MPLRPAPYSERCETLKLQPLSVRREIFTKRLDVELLSAKFVRSKLVRRLRQNRLSEEKLYTVEYLSNEPISWLIAIVNRFAEMFVNARSRNELKLNVTEILNVRN